MRRNFLIFVVYLAIMTLLYLLGVWVSDAMAETIRPLGAYQSSGSLWANLVNSYDNSLTTAASGSPGNDDNLYVGASGSVATDAWQAPSGSYTAATLYCVAEKTWVLNGNDTLAVEVRNSADTIVATLLAATAATVPKTTYSWTLTSGYLSDPTDLRCVFLFDRIGGGDSITLYSYETWIVGNLATTRERIFNIGQKEERNETEIYGMSASHLLDLARRDAGDGVRRDTTYYEHYPTYH